MSDPMTDLVETKDASRRDWCLYINDMIEFSEKVLAYSDGFDLLRFEQSGLNYDATVRNLELVGEAATHVPNQARELAPHIPWRKIIAMRNRLIHGYLGIDNDTLWSAIHEDIPPLLENLKALLKLADEHRVA